MKCPSIIRMGDDHGDSAATFHCDLEDGHAGRHAENGNLYDKHPYTLSWEGDMRETCERCGKKIPYCRLCTVCDKMICSDCSSPLGGDGRISDRCKLCPEPPEEKKTMDQVFS